MNTGEDKRESKYLSPELLKHAEAQFPMSVIRDFLEWCDGQKIELSAWVPSGRWLLPIIEDRERMLERYFGIDANELERERRALLEKCR